MRSHQDIRRILVERIVALLEISSKLPQPFRPYQQGAMSNMNDWLSDLSGTKRGYIEHATGLGKTVMFASLAAVCHGLRILIVEPSKVLVEQTIRRISQYSGGPVGYIASIPEMRDEEGRLIGRRGYDGVNIVVTTDESLCGYATDLALHFRPDVLVFDECHWGYLGNTNAALAHFPEAVIIGFSATANYLTPVQSSTSIPFQLDNGQEMYGLPHRTAQRYFETLIDQRTMPWGIKQGWLAPLASGMFDTELALGQMKINEGECGLDYYMAAVTNFLGGNWVAITRAICNLYASGKYDLAGRQVFAVCPGVREAEELATAMNLLGIPSSCVVGKTRDHDRRATLEAYQDKRLRFLTSVGVLREGWDANPEVCLMFYPTISYVRYAQILGRIMRPSMGKVGLVLDGGFRTFNGLVPPLTAPYLFGQLDRPAVSGEILLNTSQGASGVMQSPSRSPYVITDKPERKRTSFKAKMATDKIVLHLLFRLLCEHLVDMPNGKQYIKIPLTLLETRCGQDRATAIDFLERMREEGLIIGDSPWEVISPKSKIELLPPQKRRPNPPTNRMIRATLSARHTDADYYRKLQERASTLTGSAIVHAPLKIVADCYLLSDELATVVLERLAASGAIESVDGWRVVKLNN